MKGLQQILILSSRMLLIAILVSSCIKNEFVEPPDPFERQRLEADHASFSFGNGVDSFGLLTNAKNVTFTEKGNIRIRGTIFADRDSLAPIRLSQGDFILLKKLTPGQKSVFTEEYGELPVSKGSFKLLNATGGTTEFEGFGGYAEFTLPQVGLLQDLEIPTVDGSPIGFAQGSELGPDFPVAPDRTYFFFYYDDLADFTLSQAAFSVSRMALDPDDPYFYVHANALSIPGFESLEEGGFATSVQGFIPFRVPSSLGFGNVENFDHGNLLIEGTINLEPFFGVPIVIDNATAVVGFNTTDDGVNFFNGTEVPFMMGLKGGFLLSIHDLAQWELGEAAVSLRIAGYNNFRFSWAGMFDNEISIFEPFEKLAGIDSDKTAWDFIKLPQEVRKFRTWGTLGSSPSDWEFGLYTSSEFVLPHIMTIDLGGVEFEINPDRLYYNCWMPISFFGTVGMEGEIEKSGKFRLKAYARGGETIDLSILEIDVGYRAHFLIDVDAWDDWYFEVYGKVYLDISIGEPWMEAHNLPELKTMADPRLKASVSFKGSLNSSGKFKCEVKFSFAGIGYTFKFSFKLNDSSPYAFESLEEIPLDEVPLENRFEIIDYN